MTSRAYARAGRWALTALVSALCAGCGRPQPRPTLGPSPPQNPAPAGTRSGSSLDYPALLDGLLDLNALASFPDPPFVSGLSSSRDPRSVAPDAPGWFDNADRGHFVREQVHGDRTESVLAELTGPGLVTRIWTANPKGTLRIYIDGESEPALQADMKALLGGDERIPPPLAMTTARGYNLYLPLPFRSRCVITTDQGKGLYYQVHFRRYAADVALPSLSNALLERHKSRIAATAEALQRSLDARPVAQGRTLRKELSASTPALQLAAEPGGSALVMLRLGPGAAERLRSSRLQIACDGQPPQVDVPLLPFFGVAPDPRPHRSLPLAVHADGSLESRWVMPFARGLVLRIVDAPAEPVSVELRLSPRRFEPNRSMYFRAVHQHVRDLSTREPFDFPLFHVRGAGVYAGNLLHVFNPAEGWWGEGDEKIFVDGEPFPSHFGTGTEDYYGYAWCSTELFEHAFHGQSRADGPKNGGHVTNTRFHVPDPIPFERSLRFDLEVRHWQQIEGLELETVSYWYALPPPAASR